MLLCATNTAMSLLTHKAILGDIAGKKKEIKVLYPLSIKYVMMKKNCSLKDKLFYV